MKEQEAIKRLEFLNDALNFNRADSDESSCALQMAIEALEKQIPKKPSKDEFDRYICPDCGWIVYTDEFGGRYLTHCENCGKKQDWSDEDDKKL